MGWSILYSPGSSVTQLGAADLTTVQNAVDAAIDGDTVRLPASSSATWTGGLTVSKAIVLDLNGCTITRASGTTPSISLNTVSGKFSRITGGTFVFSSGSGYGAMYVAVGGSWTGNFRIDHCTFGDSQGNTQIVVTSAIGVIDSNTFNASTNHETIHNEAYGFGSGAGWSYDVVQGSADALYIESNTFNYAGSGGYYWGHNVAQNYYGARTVLRYNTIHNAQFDVHGASGGDATGDAGRWYECYENDFYVSVNQAFAFALRGGSGVIFNNRAHMQPGGSDATIKLEEEAPGSYPSPNQIGRGKNQTLDPLYLWNNVYVNEGGTGSGDMPVNNWTSSVIQQDRDYYLTTKSGYTPYTYPHPLRSL